MKEIKFRAWTNRDKCWCGAFAVHMSGLFRESPNNEWIDLSKQNEIILMQYTGLKDKNGVEIYENDVINVGDVEGQNYQIIWDSKNAQFIIDSEHFHLGGQSIFYQVIGNIYQNPELLN